MNSIIELIIYNIYIYIYIYISWNFEFHTKINLIHLYMCVYLSYAAIKFTIENLFSKIHLFLKINLSLQNVDNRELVLVLICTARKVAHKTPEKHVLLKPKRSKKLGQMSDYTWKYEKLANYKMFRFCIRILSRVLSKNICNPRKYFDACTVYMCMVSHSTWMLVSLFCIDRKHDPLIILCGTQLFKRKLHRGKS